MATMVDDEVLGDAFCDRKIMVLLNQSQSEIDTGRDACRGPYVAVPTEDAIGFNPNRWVLPLKAGCKSPVRCGAPPVQQSGCRERECTCADARNAPASVRGSHKTAQRISR